MTSSSPIEEIATAQRRSNARIITLVLTLLGVTVLGPAWRLGAKPLVLAAMVVVNVAYLAAHLMTRRSRVTAAVLLTVTAMLAHHVTLAVCNDELPPIPYLAAIPILIAAATLPSRWMWLILGVTGATLGVEGAVRHLDRMDHVTLLAASVLVIVTFVVSQLHVRSTERAFAVATARDAERARAAAAAIESEERFRLIADHTNDLFSLLDTEGQPLYMNPSHARLLGQTLEELMQLPLKDLVPPEAVPGLAQTFRDALTSGEAHTEATLFGVDSIEHVFDVRMTRVASRDGPLVAMTSRDITEKKQFQQRLLASERMESLGRLAGSVAHDFNNLLMVIGGAAEMARLGVKDRPDVADDIDSVIEATRTASKLTRQLLMFSRKQVVSATEVDLADALEKIRELLERLVGKKVSLVFEFDADCPKVMIAAAHLEQLAMNLSINARDAMPEGGALTFRLRARQLDDPTVAAVPAGTYAELEVKDEGFGIPADVLPHVFEPLFTTKGDAGTGLGLATCQSIVTQWHGSIAADSTVGHGSTFRVLLPASTQATAQASTRPSPIPQSIRRVLVVDDEPAPRETAARLLRASGFDVVVASSLKEARQYIADPNLALDALLTDVVLSGELGTDLLAYCRKLRPMARIVVMSGYSPNPSANAKLTAVSAKFLPKPFTRQELLNALRGESRARS